MRNQSLRAPPPRPASGNRFPPNRAAVSAEENTADCAEAFILGARAAQELPGYGDHLDDEEYEEPYEEPLDEATAAACLISPAPLRPASPAGSETVALAAITGGPRDAAPADQEDWLQPLSGEQSATKK